MDSPPGEHSTSRSVVKSVGGGGMGGGWGRGDHWRET